MAIALPLIVELIETVQHAVEWLAGGPAKRLNHTGTAGRMAPARALSQTRPVQSGNLPQRSWGGPTRACQAQRAVRVVRVAAGGIVVAGRLDEVCAELDRLAAVETLH